MESPGQPHINPRADGSDRNRAYGDRCPPGSRGAEPELVTSGPYRFVRHPIYSGLLTALLGTALVNNLLGLIVVAVLVAYFYVCGEGGQAAHSARPPPA